MTEVKLYPQDYEKLERGAKHQGLSLEQFILAGPDATRVTGHGILR
jgi:hypothetical protein